jgi:tetratricopeptide (TPR) repeat protein/DNA-binding XRE family transcriptional regulator
MKMQIPKTTPPPRWRLAEARTERKWSQQEVAGLIGTSYVNISRWERGITRPNPYFRRKLCALFRKSEQELDLGTGVESTTWDMGERIATGGEAKDVVEGATMQGRMTDVVERATTRVAPTMDGSSQAIVPGGVIYDSAIPLKPAIALVGRDEELGRIQQQLCNGGSVALTALNGLPGVGKTALSIALAHDTTIQEHFRDGILWAGLGPQPNIAGHLSRWGALLGISINTMAALSSVEEWAKTLRAAIGSRAMLLVIDDAWKVEDALALKVGGPNCAHLVTTRFPSIATHITVDGATMIQELDEHHSIELLRKLAPGVVEAEAHKAADLVQAVGGLPLALKLMGNYLRKEAHSGKARRIGAALERLTSAEERLRISEPQGPMERHTTLAEHTSLSLQSVFAVTDQRLKEPERTALYALSVFPPKPNSFSEEAALAVADCTVEILDALTDAGLLESADSERYTLHQTIADYAHLHLKEDTIVYERLITYVIGYVEVHHKDYELLGLEFPIILAALTVAQTREKLAELVHGVNTFAPFLIVRGLYELADQQLQHAFEAARTLEDAYGMTSSLLHLGEVAQKQGNYNRAEALYHEGLEIARKIQDAERISALLTNLGWVSSKRGEFALAEDYLQEGLILAKQIEHSERISDLLEMLGSVAGSRGDYAQSETFLQDGLMLARQVGDRERICSLLINLGVTAGEQGNHKLAESYFLEGLELARQIGHREWISALLGNLGDVAGELGNFVQAEVYFQEGLTMARQMGHREWICALLINMGLTLRKQGNYRQAKDYLRESLALARQLGRPDMISHALYESGNLCLNQQQVKKAEASFREMLTTVSEGDQDLLALANYGLARTAAAKGNLFEARKLGEMSVMTLERMGHRRAEEVRNWLDTIS